MTPRRRVPGRTTVSTSGPTDTGVDRDAVLAWGRVNLRDLPWRATRDPWRILVAEVMLQQTQVSRVVPRWYEWCAVYPTPESLASVPLGDAIARWHGLGYPRRAKNLHGAATAIVALHCGEVPHELDALLALPGIGRYTARAVMTFAFEADVGVVDTNVARVLARSAGTTLTPSAAQDRADSLVPAGEGWLWNQTMMDVGARHCRPDPQCDGCPLSGLCRWRASRRAGAPDPAVGSASVSRRQPPYDGSARQARGSLLGDLVAGRRSSAGYDATVVAGLVADGLVVDRNGELMLP